MRGLLIKDFKLMNNMKSSIMVVVLASLLMSAYIEDLSFIIVYLSLLGVTFTMSTLSYDEFDNGYAFLMTLPVTRKGYVREMYGFGLIMGMGAWLLGTVIVVGMELMKQTASAPELVMNAFSMLPSALLMLAVMLPLRLKFGSEKGRIVMIVALGVVVGVTYVGAKLLARLHLDLSALGESLAGLGDELVAAVFFLAGVLLLFLSYRISLSVMEKKEF